MLRCEARRKHNRSPVFRTLHAKFLENFQEIAYAAIGCGPHIGPVLRGTQESFHAIKYEDALWTFQVLLKNVQPAIALFRMELIEEFIRSYDSCEGIVRVVGAPEKAFVLVVPLQKTFR